MIRTGRTSALDASHGRASEVQPDVAEDPVYDAPIRLEGQLPQ